MVVAGLVLLKDGIAGDATILGLMVVVDRVRGTVVRTDGQLAKSVRQHVRVFPTMMMRVVLIVVVKRTDVVRDRVVVVRAGV